MPSAENTFCRDSKTFRPKKNTPVGSKVNSISLRSQSRCQTTQRLLLNHANILSEASDEGAPSKTAEADLLASRRG